MAVTGYYEEMEVIINQIIGNYLLQNQNICKLLSYYPSQKTYNFNPLDKPMVKNPNDLLMENIFPVPKLPEAENEQQCYITVTSTGGEIMADNHYREIYIVFDIICHLNSWIIKNGYRPYKIACEIDKMFNNKITTLPIVNAPQSLPHKARDYSNKYYGLQMYYLLQLNSNLGGIDGRKFK